jgi:hypothetical protein
MKTLPPILSNFATLQLCQTTKPNRHLQYQQNKTTKQQNNKTTKQQNNKTTKQQNTTKHNKT